MVETYYYTIKELRIIDGGDLLLHNQRNPQKISTWEPLLVFGAATTFDKPTVLTLTWTPIENFPSTDDLALCSLVVRTSMKAWVIQ
jgi:hypothetical protein